MYLRNVLIRSLEMICFLSPFLPLPLPICLISLAIKSFSTSSRTPFLVSSAYFSSFSAGVGACAAQCVVRGVSTLSQCRALSFFLGRATGKPRVGTALYTGWGKKCPESLSGSGGGGGAVLPAVLGVPGVIGVPGTDPGTDPGMGGGGGGGGIEPVPGIGGGGGGGGGGGPENPGVLAPGSGGGGGGGGPLNDSILGTPSSLGVFGVLDSMLGCEGPVVTPSPSSSSLASVRLTLEVSSSK